MLAYMSESLSTQPQPAPESSATPATATTRPTPLVAVLVLTFACSLGTGSMWNALPFVTEHDFHFTKSENLALAIMEAVVYIAAAYNCGRIVKSLRGHLSPRGVIQATLWAQALACPASSSRRLSPVLWAQSCGHPLKAFYPRVDMDTRCEQALAC